MLQIHVNEIKGGEILEKDIMLEDYSILLSKGTKMKVEYVGRLKELGVNFIFIEENKQLSKEEKLFIKSNVNNQITKKVQTILEKHIYQKNDELIELNIATENILKDILDNDNVVETIYEIKARSTDLYEHSINLCALSILTALRLNLPYETTQQIGVGCLLHDIGLRYLSFAFDNGKIENLSEQDKREFKKHPIYGYTILRSENWVAEVTKNIVLYHHERLDSSGYPLHAFEIPYEAQIVSVIDAFDELICGIGCKAVPVSEAIEYLKIYSGSKYNAEIVDTVLQFIAVYPAGVRVKTNEGEEAVVLSQNKGFPDRPVLKIVKDRFGIKLVEPQIKDLLVNNTIFIKEEI